MNPIALIAAIKINLLRRPLMHLETVSDCLDMSREEIMAKIDSGDFAWAFNIAAGKSRAETRVLAHCVVEKSLGTIPAIGATRNLKLPEVVNLILPPKRETLRGAELQRLFHASANLIHDLSAAGEIKKVSEKLPAHGVNASPRFTRDSLVKLLERRRLN